jgi:hypothetical protein
MPQTVYIAVSPIVPQMTNFNHIGKSSIYSPRKAQMLSVVQAIAEGNGEINATLCSRRQSDERMMREERLN